MKTNLNFAEVPAGTVQDTVGESQQTTIEKANGGERSV
jgi:hypothetical protein